MEQKDNLLTLILKLLESGKEVSNPEFLKHSQNAINALIIMVSTALGILQASGISFNLSEIGIIWVAVIIFVFLSIFNIIATTISTKKIGLFSSQKGKENAKSN